MEYRKTYDMLPHSYIMEYMNLFGTASNAEQFLEKSMVNWRTEMTAYERTVG